MKGAVFRQRGRKNGTRTPPASRRSFRVKINVYQSSPAGRRRARAWPSGSFQNKFSSRLQRRATEWLLILFPPNSTVPDLRYQPSWSPASTNMPNRSKFKSCMDELRELAGGRDVTKVCAGCHTKSRWRPEAARTASATPWIALGAVLAVKTYPLELRELRVPAAHYPRLSRLRHSHRQQLLSDEKTNGGARERIGMKGRGLARCAVGNGQLAKVFAWTRFDEGALSNEVPPKTDAVIKGILRMTKHKEGHPQVAAHSARHLARVFRDARPLQ